MSELEIRRMGFNDYPQVRPLLHQVSRGRAMVADDMVLRFLRWDGFHPWLGLIDGVIVAYAELHQLPNFPHGGWEGRIERVVTHEAHRGRGYGDELQTHLISLARQIGCLRIELRAENPKAQAMYAKHGFEWVPGSKVGVLNLHT